MTHEIQLRTGAWRGDGLVTLPVPANWDVTTYLPSTPPPLTGDRIADILERPTGQKPLRHLCRGAGRPLVIVDDLQRPTPAARVLPAILEHFREAGISPSQVTILVATGSHGRPSLDAVMPKIGPCARACRVLVHDPARQLVPAGRTSFGTPVVVNREVMASDFVMGIGGLYPNHTAGFGGGSKLVLGVLGLRTIGHLHYSHPSMGPGSLAPVNRFRADLDEIARMVRLRTMVTLQVNADREPVRMACGDHFAYYAGETAFCRETFSAPSPGGADVVIANSYPNDLFLTFAQMKGFAPLRQCRPDASRIAIAGCSEGLGYHGLYPFLNAPRFHAVRKAVRIFRAQGLLPVYEKLSGKFRPGTQPAARNPIRLFRPGDSKAALPAHIPGIQVTSNWNGMIEAVAGEHSNRKRLCVAIYPCAPLQILTGPESQATLSKSALEHSTST